MNKLSGSLKGGKRLDELRDDELHKDESTLQILEYTHGVMYYHVSGVPWLIITRSGLDDWIY
jgi:hypothetical protein